MSEKESPHGASQNSMAARLSILSMLRLSIGLSGDRVGSPPDNEEKVLIEDVFRLRNALFEAMGEKEPTLIVAMVAATQFLEDILCKYENDMPDVLAAVLTKLAHHGTQHMDLKDNPPQEIKFTGTIH